MSEGDAILTKIEEEALAHATATFAEGPSVLVGLRLGAATARRLHESDRHEVAIEWRGGQAAAELAAFRALARLGARFDEPLSAAVEPGTIAAIARADATLGPAILYVTCDAPGPDVTRIVVRAIGRPGVLAKRHPAEEAARKLAELIRRQEGL